MSEWRVSESEIIMVVRHFEDWVETVHPIIKSGPLWGFQAYQKALFVYDLAWEDCGNLLHDERGGAVARQLIRCVGAIGANIKGGYGRGYGPDYAYRLRIAMGETRESQGWYWRAHKLLAKKILDHRLGLLDEIIAMLTPVIEQQKNYKK